MMRRTENVRAGIVDTALEGIKGGGASVSSVNTEKKAELKALAHSVSVTYFARCVYQANDVRLLWILILPNFFKIVNYYFWEVTIKTKC